jgi:hypothetical protein
MPNLTLPDRLSVGRFDRETNQTAPTAPPYSWIVTAKRSGA